MSNQQGVIKNANKYLGLLNKIYKSNSVNKLIEIIQTKILSYILLN